MRKPYILNSRLFLPTEFDNKPDTKQAGCSCSLLHNLCSTSQAVWRFDISLGQAVAAGLTRLAQYLNRARMNVRCDYSGDGCPPTSAI